MYKYNQNQKIDVRTYLINSEALIKEIGFALKSRDIKLLKELQEIRRLLFNSIRN